mmetsp:Transcript_11841/g.30421  ORF Transcript_11841/g.30421 Transcript_11841/m.30421 type:complete len:177 (-) Transcript_11841:24-554(-)
MPGTLYVSNAEAAGDRDLLAHLDIAAVISVGGGHRASSAPGVRFLHFGIKDRTSTDYTQILREAVGFAGAALKDGKSVLVHCLRGMHRSPTVAAGLLVAVGGLSGKEARSCVQAARPSVNFNAHLAAQIDAFEVDVDVRAAGEHTVGGERRDGLCPHEPLSPCARPPRSTQSTLAS